MKRVITEQRASDRIEVNKIEFRDDPIVVYITAGGNGVGVLCDLTDYGNKDNFGFIYHRDMCRGCIHSHKYTASTKVKAINKVLADNKEVYVFVEYYEFLTWVKKYLAY